MENKKVLGKIIPAVLVLVLALLLVITISSCSKGKNTPVGAIEDKKDYLKIDIADDKAYSVSKLEFYDKLRYVGYDTFEDALYEAALNDIVKKIKDDIEANKADLSNATYFKRFKYVIDAEVYGSTDEEEINDKKDEEKEKDIKTYLNMLKQYGYELDGTDNIYQKASFEYQTIKLAKREYARSVLLEEIDDEDSENKVTNKQIEEFFGKKVENRGDFSALLILFSSQTEINEALRQLNLKFIGNKLYRVPAANATYADPDAKTDPSKRTLAEYEEYYNDFDNTKEGIGALDNNEVLFQLCRVYNYIYSYRNKLTFEIDGKDYLNETDYPFNPLLDSYSPADIEKIKSCSLEDMTALLLAQDNGDIKTSPRLKYDFETIDEIDTVLRTDLYSKYAVNSEEYTCYNTPSSTYTGGNYLVFKLEDADEVSYKAIKALVELQEGIANSEDQKAIDSYIEVIRQSFDDLLKGLKIFDDKEKVKAWALDYADKVTAFGLTGAKNILASTEDRENPDSIWSRVFEQMLTDEYIEEKLKKYLDEECKITIYDSLFEVQFAQKYDFYKAGNKKSKDNILKVKVKEKDLEVEIKANDMFDRLEKRYGAETSSSILFNQILKDKYYSTISEKKKKEYEDEYEQILTYFAQGQSSQYGYNPAIGQKAFINLYFKADNKEDAIFNMWVANELQNTLLYKNPTDIMSDILDSFKTLSEFEMANYVNVEYNLIYVYTDDDEDGEADDWTIVDDSDARKQEVMKLSAELLNIINERATAEYSNSNREDAYNGLHSKYVASSRVSTIGNRGDGDPIPTEGFKTTAEQDAFYFAKYKAKGLLLSQQALTAVNTLKALRDLDDDAYELQLKLMYKYMIENHSSDLTVDQIFARKLFEGDSYANIDTVDETNVFEFKLGFGSFYLYNSKKAPSYKFEVKDNADTSTGSKVYPYSIDIDDPFPVDENNKPIDNSADTEHTLYNSNDTLTKNQIIMYVREYKDGVESLSTDVINAFKDYFEEDIMKNYVSTNFIYYISNILINDYIASGKITIDDDLKAMIDKYVETRHEALFGFTENEFTAKWFDTFK